MNNKNNSNDFRNKVDLMYLTKPNNLIQVKKDKDEDYTIKNINKYKSYILRTTKKLLDEEMVTEKINESFKVYAENIIQHYKFNNRKRIVQQQYQNLNKEKKIEKYKPINIDEMDINIIGKKKETKKIDLNNFVKKNKVKKKKKMVIPQKHNFN